MRRRILLASTVAAALSPGIVRAQQKAMPVVGFLNSRTQAQGQYLVAAVREGLKQTGFVDGENMTIDYRWSEGDISRLPALAAELVQRRVAVIVAGGTSQPAKAATTSIPIVFTTGLDPVAYGLVESLNRPGGNLTGISTYSGALVSKQLELLRELVPRAATVGLLVKPDNPSSQLQIADLREAARTLGQPLDIVNAATEADFELAIAGFARKQNAAMIVSIDPYFDSHAGQLAALAARYALPTIYNLREYVDAGGLMSYGGSIVDTYRQAGIYAGRILKGAKPSELPVLLPTTFALVINLKTAKALGLTISPSILVRADEVIE
jgi:putative ABC transport system substrate-binding protein